MNMAYLYGISDFWSEFFSDSEIIDGILEQETKLLSEAYSYFLQRTSGISLQDVQDYHKATISLLLIGSHNYVSESEFTVGEVSAKMITNRSILPTQTLYEGRDYEVVDGILRFNRPVNEYKFPIRHNTDGSWQYAIWLNDVVFDGGWAYKSYGRLVGFDKDDAIENYKAFLEGVYFLYTQGPTMAHIEKGVNMAMGMPYARATEEVLDVFEDLDSGDYTVITGTQSYQIPFGYSPNVVPGDVLIENEVIDSWVEIIDYVKKDGWWYNIYFPSDLLNTGSSSDIGRCVPGSKGDTLMKAAKYHTFEVLITRPAGDIDAFNIANRLVKYSRPSWTFPIFVWKVPLPDDRVKMEESIQFTLKNHASEYCVSPPDIRFMRRDTGEFSRGKHWYMRNSVNFQVNDMLGQGVRSYAGYEASFETPDEFDITKLLTVIGGRDTLAKPISRGEVTRGLRGDLRDIPEYISRVIPADCTYDSIERIIRDDQIVGLYLIDRYELQDKLGRPVKDVEVILSDMISREGGTSVHTNILPLDHNLSPYAYSAYAPEVDGKVELLVYPCINDTLSVSWIVSSSTVAATAILAEDGDYITVIEDLAGPVTRSTVERNQAEFLMDRSREDGVYNNGRGDTYYMTRDEDFIGWKIPRRV